MTLHYVVRVLPNTPSQTLQLISTPRAIQFKVGRQPGVFLFFGIVALWGVVQDCGQKLGRTATSLLRPLIRRAYYELVLTHYGARYEPDRPTVAVMDEAAELLVGGPLSGLLVDMFQ